VGIVVPWNFPIFLALSPLVGALAAGNRAMLKASEFAPASGELLQEVIAQIFDEDEVTVVTGGVDVASAFTSLPFDHLVFTGSTQVGKIVMKAAAENLTPVTLELGGKSPVIIHKDFPIEEAASRIAFGKGINAGQVCVSPDYILCPRDQVDAFCNAFAAAMGKAYPTLRDNHDYTAIITYRQQARLHSYLQDAQDKGAQLITINPAGEDFSGTRKMPMTLIRGATDDMLVLNEEIFGPILPVIPYDTLDNAIAYVNDRPRPLALYYFDWDKGRSNDILARTHAGGVCINDTMSHVMADDIPFGGVGPSGMGHYHGEEGFRNFSKVKGVVRKGRINATAFVAPPWDNFMFNSLKKLQAMRFRRRKID
jgi:coniferyl-aldehyde dehydrogenase